MSLVLRQTKGSALTYQEMDGNFTYLEGLAQAGGGAINVTYSDLTTLISGSNLVPGAHYLITDFQTCYDQPDFDYDKNPITSGNYKTAPIEPVMVLATSTDTLAAEAYQPLYPSDTIKYDVTYSVTEATGSPAKGRISERIDEYNNRTDYDHRTIVFKRYPYYQADLGNPYSGTVDVVATGATGMTVGGTGTNFTSLLVGDRVNFGAQSSYKSYEVLSIIDDFNMTLTGLSGFTSGGFITMYPTNYSGVVGYHQNNIDNSGFSEEPTFDMGSDTYNNTIGDYYALAKQDGETFWLANNVFIGQFVNNTIGSYSFNNTTDDDCTDNVIGPWFANNITNDDFDDNTIGSNFYNNVITSNFQRNRIASYFRDNYLVENSFNSNEIMNYFENNTLCNDSFSQNVIGNDFYNNTIKNWFFNNHIGSDVHDNFFSGTFSFNTVGIIFNNNAILGSFTSNSIMNYFEYNNIQGSFSFNKIGDLFQYNVIGDGFGFGGGIARGNTIGSAFISNNIGEYFYDNSVVDQVQGITTGEYFQYNSIKTPIGGVDFTVNLGNITSSTFNNPSGADGPYNGVVPTTSGGGTGAVVDITVSGGAVSGVSVTNAGHSYLAGDSLTVLGSVFGGVDISGDLTISVLTVSTPPKVYTTTNCDILRMNDGSYILQYVDSVSPSVAFTGIDQA